MSATIDPQAESSSLKNGLTNFGNARALSSQLKDNKFWRENAPKGVLDDNGRAVWARYLAKRRRPQSVDAICDADGTALAWGVNVSAFAGDIFELVQLAAQATRGKLPQPVAISDTLSQWRAGRCGEVQSVEHALGCLAIANLLPCLAEVIDDDLWWSLADLLADTVSQSQDWRIDADAAPSTALAHQLISGELPLTLAYLFPEIRPFYKLRTVAQDVLTEGLMEFLNGAGLPKSTLLPASRGLLACWTRCRAIGSRWGQGFWSSKAEDQYRLAASKSICLSTCTGDALLCGPDVPAWTPDFLAAVLKFGGRAIDRTAAFDLFDKKLTKGLDGKSGKRVPEFSEVCEWSGLALLRTELGREGTAVAIDFATPVMKIDVWVGSRQLLQGNWTAEIASDGQPLTAVGSWEETCWFSDSDVDYVEFSIDLDKGARLERQVLLARKDKFLLVVDNVMNAPGMGLQNRLSIPMGSGVGLVPEAETREGMLIGDRLLARVLPLALPEWRTDPRIGELTSKDGLLQLVEERPGKNLSCPLFIDLDPKRLNKPCTWRQLTIAESLEIQPHDVAVGYRVQCGKKQWLVYRSQGPTANRTLLGYNLSIEGMIGRFSSPSGEVQELLQIEG